MGKSMYSVVKKTVFLDIKKSPHQRDLGSEVVNLVQESWILKVEAKSG